LALAVFAVIGGMAAAIMLLPSWGRRVAVSVLIVLHFGGIVTAVTSADNGWLPNQLWNLFYRPYLQFMYLNNAYHFYAPEPGPAPLLWFCIEYQEDPIGFRNFRWVKVPTIDKDGEHLRPDGSRLWPNLEFTRRLSLAESANYPGPPIHPLAFQALAVLRDREADKRGLPRLATIPMSAEQQYRPPNLIASKWLAMYVRHVAHTFPHEIKPHLEVVGVKAYRVIHQIIDPKLLTEGVEPDDPELYKPFYMGEYDKDGQLKPSTLTIEWDEKEGQWIPTRDPLLYWYIPIMRPDVSPPPAGYGQPFRVMIPPERKKVVNYVYIHAGDIDREELP
jgi:hypothetical protein